MEREQQAGGTEPEGRSTTVYHLPAVAWAVEVEEQGTPGEPQADPGARTVIHPTVPSEASGAGETAETAGTSEQVCGDVPRTPPAAEAAAAEEARAAPPEEQREAPVGRPGRISRPMIAAAAMAGVVLMGLPLGLSRIGGDGPHHDPPEPPPAGFSQQGGGGSGFVPGFDDQGGSRGKAAAVVPGLPAAGPTPSATPSPKASRSAVVAVPRTRSVPGHAPRPAVTRQPARSGAGTPQPAPTTSAPAPATFRAVAGPWCSHSGAGFKKYNWFVEGQDGWTVAGTGGWTGDNCSGGYVAMPMSGDTREDLDSSSVWTFSTGAVSSGSCRLSVYIPDNGDTKVVGGKPSYYTVQNQFAPGTGTIGSFSIDQTAHRGEWVGAGTFPVSSGRIAVMLHDRGLDWSGTARTYAHHVAAALRVNCTA